MVSYPPLGHLRMTDDKPAQPARPDQRNSPRGSDAADPLAQFPTEIEVAAAQKAEARAREGRKARNREAAVPAPLRAWSRGWRFLRALAAGVLVVIVLLLAAGASMYFTSPDVGRRMNRLVSGAVPDAPSTLIVETTPPGWSVIEGDKVLGATPLNVALPPGRHALLLRHGTTTRPLSVTLPRGAQVVHHLDMTEPPEAPTAGTLQVTTVPPGAAVALDGVMRGAAPLHLDQLAPGVHTVVVANAGRVVSQQVTVTAGETATLLVPLGQAPAPPPPAAPAPAAPALAVGWVAITAGIELEVYDGDALVGSSRNERIMLMPGLHTLRLVNSALGFETTSAVTVRPGVLGTVAVQVPNGSLSVNAVPWAEVLLDGTAIGETPIANYSVAPGSHELVFRNPRFPEQRRTVLVSLTSPTHVGVDLRQ